MDIYKVRNGELDKAIAAGEFSDDQLACATALSSLETCPVCGSLDTEFHYRDDAEFTAYCSDCEDYFEARQTE